MSDNAKEELLHAVAEGDVHFIRMQFTDIFGQLKNVDITSSQLKKALNNQIMMDGSSIEGFVRIEESDQYLWPDLSSFTVLPWQSRYGTVARLICDIHEPDGVPFGGDPRYVLKRALRQAEEMGFTFNVGPELEFFLFHTDEDGRPTVKTADEAGYFDMAPLDHGESTRREICLALEEMGFEIEASHHEAAAGQHEIDFKYSEALLAADRIMTFKLAVKTLAQKNGLHATFMPKPVYGAAGSGMHVNMSLFDRQGRNVFYDENDPRKLSLLAYQFTAGLLAHIQGLCAVTNPLVNSYKRLVPGYEAPCYPVWSTGNRSALIRIPAPRGQSTRLELRNPDPSCNPYLTFAACLAAGLDGIRRGLTPPDEVAENVYSLTEAQRTDRGIERLPGTLEAAVEAMLADEVVTTALGPHVTEQYAAGKLREWEDYRTQVSRWEIEKYLVLY